MNQWTNPTMRARLGERGFITVEPAEKIGSEAVMRSTWVRGEEIVVLVESTTEPYILHNGILLDPDLLGWRNEQIQHNKLKGD